MMEKEFKIIISILLLLLAILLILISFQIGEMWGWAKGAEQTMTYCMVQNMTIN